MLDDEVAEAIRVALVKFGRQSVWQMTRTAGGARQGGIQSIVIQAGAQDAGDVPLPLLAVIEAAVQVIEQLILAVGFDAGEQAENRFPAIPVQMSSENI